VFDVLRRSSGVLSEIGCHSFRGAGTHSAMDSFQTMSDGALLRAAREEPEAFGAFYRRHVVAVERWIRRQTPDSGTAADLTGETFAQALVRVSKFRGSTMSLRAAGCTASRATWCVAITAAAGLSWRCAPSSAFGLSWTPTSWPISMVNSMRRPPVRP
jgi:hypothetical protein